MAYAVEFTRSALREFKVLDRQLQRRIATHIDELANDPFPHGCKRLVGEPDHYRIRIGDYRVIYRVEGRRLIVVVVKIGHRKDVYR